MIIVKRRTYLVVLALGVVTIVSLNYMYMDTIGKRKRTNQRINKLIENAKRNPNDEQAARQLIEMARGGYSFGATKATVALGEIGASATSVLPEIAMLLKSRNPYVSREAAIALGKLGPLSEPVLRELEHFIVNGDPNVDATWFAADAIGRIGKPARRSIEVLRKQIGKSPQLDAAVGEALSRLKKE